MSRKATTWGLEYRTNDGGSRSVESRDGEFGARSGEVDGKLCAITQKGQLGL